MMDDPLITCDLANRIVNAIIDDLAGRSGLDAEWDAIDADIQREIVREWCEIVSAEIVKENAR